MLPWSLLALGCLVTGALSFVVAEGALVDSREIVALCWVAAGLAGMRAAVVVCEKRAP